MDVCGSGLSGVGFTVKSKDKGEMVAREGIEHDAERLSITALLNDRKLSYPRRYPQLNLGNSATEPQTLGRVSGVSTTPLSAN